MRRIWFSCLPCALLLCACTDDGLDGKASKIARVDASVATSVDASASFVDGGFELKSVDLTLSCPRAALGDSVASGFVAHVLDANDEPAPAGLWIKLTPTTGTVRTGHEGGGPTDRTGSLAFDYVAPHVDADTTIGLDAELLGAHNDTLASANCNFDVVTDAVRFVEPAADSVIQFAAPTPLTLELTVAGLPAKCKAGGGIDLSFKGPVGGGVALAVAGPFKQQLCVDLDAHGNPPPLHIGGATQGGSAAIGARVAQHASNLSVTMVGPPETLHLEADEQDIAVQSASNITVHVLDSTGQAVEGVTVLFRLGRCAVSKCAPGEAVSPAEAISGSDGTASAAYFAGTTPGAAQIVVQVQGHSNVSASLVVRVN